MKKLIFLCALIAPMIMAADYMTGNGHIEDAARDFLLSQKAGKAMAGANFDYDTVSVHHDELGQSHIRLQPVINGLPVYGEHIIVHANSKTRQVLGVQGDVKVSPRALSAKASFDPMRNIDARIKNLGGTDFELISDPEFAYLMDADRNLHYTYKVEVTYENEMGPQRDYLFIDAANGKMVGRHPQHHFARDRRTYTANNGTSLPGTLRRNESSSNTGDSCIDDAHNYAGDTYDYYQSVFGRDSLDGNGMTLVSTAHYQSNYNNAFWTGSQMVYGDGDGNTFSCLSGDLDVVAHELTHGLTSNSANLVYQNESGALNEATSDIIAAAIEKANGASTTDTWLLGEDIYTPGTNGDALRYMNNPTQDNSSTDYYPTRYTGSQDNGGVHWNSGIANLFFYLLVEGGTHPRNVTTQSVSGIGMTDAVKIWYRALVTYMGPNTTFAQARTHTEQAAEDLFGASSNQKTQVSNAWTAVGVGSSGGGGSTGGEVTNGTPVTGLGTSSGSWLHFYADVPSGASNLVASISGGSGDADLYTRFGSQPTTSSYNCRPYQSGNNETCTEASPSAGRWYFSIRAYSTFSNVTLNVSWDAGSGGSCGDTGTVNNIGASTGNWNYYTQTVPSCATKLTVEISGGSGDADLYTRFGSNPTTSSYSCRPYRSGNNETCTINNPSAGTWHYGIRAYSTYSGVTLNATYE